eukprot:4763263-Prymnesium_polylepis.1
MGPELHKAKAVPLENALLNGASLTLHLWVHGGLGGYIEAAASADIRSPESTPAPAMPPPASSGLAQTLARLTLSEQRAHVEEVVLKVVRELTGTSASELVEETPLMESGVDSLAATELSSQLRALTGVALSATLMFEHPTPRAVAAHLIDQATEIVVTESLRKRTGSEPSGAIAGRCPGGCMSHAAQWRVQRASGRALLGVSGTQWRRSVSGPWDVGSLRHAGTVAYATLHAAVAEARPSTAVPLVFRQQAFPWFGPAGRSIVSQSPPLVCDKELRVVMAPSCMELAVALAGKNAILKTAEEHAAERLINLNFDESTGVVVIELNDVNHFNALGKGLADELGRAVQHLLGQTPTTGYLIQGSGPHFSIGAY